MNSNETISVRFVCPWRDNAAGTVAAVPRDVAAQLLRFHVAVPAGRVCETAAFTSPRETETRNV